MKQRRLKLERYLIRFAFIKTDWTRRTHLSQIVLDILYAYCVAIEHMQRWNYTLHDISHDSPNLLWNIVIIHPRQGGLFMMWS